MPTASRGPYLVDGPQVPMCVRDLVVVQLQSHAVVNLVVCQRDVILQAVINGGLYLCFMSARSGTGCPSQLSLTREKIGTSQVAGSKQARAIPCRYCTTSECESSLDACRSGLPPASSGPQWYRPRCVCRQ